jgi:ABC-type branched-subunit amino acid transport system substrate-binding protein
METGILKILATFISVWTILFAPVTAFPQSCHNMACIGVILPLSVHGEFGTAFMNGIRIATEPTKAGANDLRFIFEDSAFDSKRAVAGFARLANQGVHAVYVLGGPTSEAVAPLASRAKLVTLVSSNDPSIAISNPGVLRFANPASDFGRAIREELVTRGLFRVALVATENPYMNSILAALQTDADSRFSFVELHRGGGDIADFRSVVSRLKRMRPDIVGVMLHPGQISQFYRQLAEQRVSVQSFGADALESEREVAASGPAIRGAFFVNHDISSSFRAQYTERYGNDDMIAFAAWGHDLALILRDALGDNIFRSARPGSHLTTSPDQILSLRARTYQQVQLALEQDRCYAGATGEVRYIRTQEGDRYFSFPLTVKTMR